ncbi:uncharacterized protein [Rutidosis leptorrhynchoides]|uniref:uncharacterized protein n=1 Tax=Rutidosis leptorrhynchoides TaxID=125765 RepID=UPI003A9991C1
MAEEASTALTLISKIDFGDPLYLHASDTTGTPIIPIKLKGTENYAIWSRSMRLALSTKNKVGFIDATCIKNTEDADLYSGQIYYTVASVVWNELKDTYDKVDGSNIFNIHMKINSLKQNGASVSDYYHNLNSLWKQYDEMVKLPACTCAAANVAQEQTKILRLNQFLMGLDDEFMQIRSNILLRDPIPGAKTAFAVISREESHRRFVSSHVSSKSQNTVFMSQFGNTGSNQSYNNRNRNDVRKVGMANKLETCRCLPASSNGPQIKYHVALICLLFTLSNVSA